MEIVVKLSEEHSISFRGRILFRNAKVIGCATIEVTGYESYGKVNDFSLGVHEKTPCYEKTEMLPFASFERFVLGVQAIMNILEEIPLRKDVQFMSCEHCGWGGPTQ